MQRLKLGCAGVWTVDVLCCFGNHLPSMQRDPLRRYGAFWQKREVAASFLLAAVNPCWFGQTGAVSHFPTGQVVRTCCEPTLSVMLGWGAALICAAITGGKAAAVQPEPYNRHHAQRHRWLLSSAGIGGKAVHAFFRKTLVDTGRALAYLPCVGTRQRGVLTGRDKAHREKL